MSAYGERLRWDGFDYDTCCNLCGAMRPGPTGDERLLRREPFERFVYGASLYRDRVQGERLVREWARRHGLDPEPLLVRAGLA